MKTHIVYLLDRSGSMRSIQEDTIGGFNAYLEQLQKDEGADDLFMTRVQFDSGSIDTETSEASVKSVGGLDAGNFVPRGSTPLLEAAIKVIEAVEAKGSPYDKVIMTIVTDGYENASREEYSFERLKKLISAQEEKGWEFVFLGAGFDNYSEGYRMGVNAGQTMSYDSGDRISTQNAYGSLAANTLRSSKGGDMSFSAEQKGAAGDKFAKAPEPKKPEYKLNVKL